MERGRLASLLVAAATAAIFLPLLDYPFLNWDDQDVFIRNEALRAPGLIAWAFSTRYMEHYQPLAWLTWGALARTVDLTPATAHALNVALHAACAALVYVLVRLVTTAPARLSGMLAAAIASLFWAVHPLRVEVVAWASAMPYSLALLLALLSAFAWVQGHSWTAVVLFGLSLLARPIALGLPLVALLGEAKAGRNQSRRWSPALTGVAIAIASALAESSARLAATLSEFGIGARLTLAATATWRYVWRTIAPTDLTPLDPLALTPRAAPLAIALGLTGIGLVSAAAWRWRREYPVIAGCWLAYLLLMVPAMGLVPSGLQASADRYTYAAAVPISIALARLATMEAAALPRLSRAVSGAAAVVVVGLAVLTWQEAGHWRDSVMLWTRAVDVDPRNDVALYNLGTALADQGRREEAIVRYEQVLQIVPSHPEARRNRDLLQAEKLEDEGNRLASSRNLELAVDRYAHALRLDPRRTHARAALGIALTELGRLGEARPHLTAALAQGYAGPALPNALAFVLMKSGDREGAVAVLREALRRHPDDPNIARNLAMLNRP